MSNMTDTEYVENGGTKCPVCKSANTKGGSIEVDAGHAWQGITCNQCGATWNDVYKLSGYSELEP